MKRVFERMRRVVLALSVLTLLPSLLTFPAGADKPQPAVVGRWHAVPASAPLGHVVDLVLRITAAESAAEVIVELLPSAGVEIVKGRDGWTGALSKGQMLDLPIAARVIADGTWTLGASITNRRRESPQVSGAVLTIVAKDGVATLTARQPSGSR